VINESIVNKFIVNSEFSEKLFNEHISRFLLKCKKYGFNTNLLLNNVLLGLPFNNLDLKIKIKQIQSYIIFAFRIVEHLHKRIPTAHRPF
jgi:hypothetical protein